jgi:hypothetical protein
MTTKNTTQLPASLNELEAKLNEIFGEKAPQMPENVKELIVKYGPYISLLLLALSLPVILGALGLGAILAPMAFLGGARAGMSLTIGVVISVVVLVMEALALPGLFKRQMSAWKLMFWASLVNAVGSLLSLELAGLIIGTAISWYVLFQIRSYYK